MDMKERFNKEILYIYIGVFLIPTVMNENKYSLKLKFISISQR